MCLSSRITSFFPPWLFWHHGQEDMKLICGTRIAGMNHKTRKEDKSILVPMMMKKLLLKDKQPLYWWFEWDDVTMYLVTSHDI
ncbi:hypothetical protein LOK49_LG02G01105 [Camellia lanceoleosa]|uniref:Uncharacterized protein n=1 Tax=Camellia lanceoleosa TaxID=1840588 RepID=A0ACC0IK69_9ERIC|nr:hypothetical protein LOK49_LG02G01105 [Camellia lanceoleosa]